MGYTTEFEGKFTVTPALSPEHGMYLKKFAETRRMQRDPQKLPPDPVRDAVGLPPGPEGAYFVGGTGSMGQDKDPSILEYNRPPTGQPGLWCQWMPHGDGIQWDGNEKFYHYIEWLDYLIVHFFRPWGYALDGAVKWRGEEPTDLGCIAVVANVMTVSAGRVVYG